MSKCVFIGCENSQGEYQGNPYNNYLLYLTSPIEMNKGVGNRTALVSTRTGKTIPKVKSVDFEKVFGCAPSADFLNGLVGQFVDVSFNIYGNIEAITAVK